MELDKVNQKLNKLFSAPLRDFYIRRIVFWHDEEREFEPMLEELELPGVKLLKLTGRNAFYAKQLLSELDTTSNYLVYDPISYADIRDNWLQDIEYYSESFRADLLAARAGDREAAGRLVEQNAGLIWSIARRYFGRGAEAEDLYQLGCLGFLKAIEGFDPDYGTQFSTYAVPKIAGEIRRFLRDDGMLKVSRTIKERAAQIRKAQEGLTEVLGRAPALSELAEALDLTPEEIAEAESATAAVESIQQPAGSAGLSLEAVLTDSAPEDRMVERLALAQALDQLPQREQTVIRLRYFHGLTQDRVAKVLGVSQVQVSRIEKKSLGHLRELLE